MKHERALKISIVILALLLLLFSLYGAWLECRTSNLENCSVSVFSINYATSFGPEAAGIAFTILILDFLNKRRSEHLLESQLKDQLIKEMQSRHNPTALAAVERLKINGWLVDDSLEGIDLSGANLQSANLWRSNLKNVDFGNTRLQNASMRYANLTNARNLRNSQLVQTEALMKATMPDGSLYDGRFNLIGDIGHAKRHGVNIQDPKSTAKYFGIPLTNYLQGQQWAKDNLLVLKTNSRFNQDIFKNNEENNGNYRDDKIQLLLIGAIIAAISSTITIIAQKLRSNS